jgi:hypothetical protein
MDPMNIYIVSIDYGYEGDEVIGASLDLHRARGIINEYRNQSTWYPTNIRKITADKLSWNEDTTDELIEAYPGGRRH